MVRTLIQCDGAPVPPSFRQVSWDRRESLNHTEPGPSLNLRLQNLSHALLAEVSHHAADLVRIAAYAYAADQMVSRGGPSDVYGRKWRREFAMCIPVTDPDFWNQPHVLGHVESTLSFLSGDLWRFGFASATPKIEQLTLDMGPADARGHPDSVVLFSGGADSLCATIEAVSEHGARPVLVSHRPVIRLDSRQKVLVQLLRERFPQWDFPHISVWVHRRGSDAADVTQRTRSFLFASLGAAVASELGLGEVLLADNGIVSLNLPVNAQLIGTLASRSTHPKFINLFNELSRMVVPGEPRIVNPLRLRTRAEVLEVLKLTETEELLEETTSCARSRGRPIAQPHCGVCSQCIDRRFGSISSGLEEYDPPERYGTDIFYDALPEGVSRTLAESYVRFALHLRNTPEHLLFDEYPQLYDCLDPDEAPQDTAEALVSVLKRHAAQTLTVMEKQVAERRYELVSRSLPPTSLISIHIAPERALEADFRHSPDFRSVALHGRRFSLTASQAHVIQILFESCKNGTPDVGQAFLLEAVESTAKRLVDLFKNSDAWGKLVVPGDSKGSYRLNL